MLRFATCKVAPPELDGSSRGRRSVLTPRRKKVAAKQPTLDYWWEACKPERSAICFKRAQHPFLPHCPRGHFRERWRSSWAAVRARVCSPSQKIALNRLFRSAASIALLILRSATA